jgi:hypothetical protein
LRTRAKHTRLRLLLLKLLLLQDSCLLRLRSQCVCAVLTRPGSKAACC